MFNINLDFKLTDIIDILIENKNMFIPGILYLIFNNLLPMWAVIGVIVVYFIFTQITKNSKLSAKIDSLENKLSSLVMNTIDTKKPTDKPKTDAPIKK
tara:strand:+ start:1871 stop:2164 length:294 start_codon:yes stop_codon:yes gene_type:complete